MPKNNNVRNKFKRAIDAIILDVDLENRLQNHWNSWGASHSIHVFTNTILTWLWLQISVQDCLTTFTDKHFIFVYLIFGDVFRLINYNNYFLSLWKRTSTAVISTPFHSSSYSWYTFTAKATYKRRKAVVTGEYAYRVHDLTMAVFDNNSSSIIGKCVLLMFLIIVQVTGQGKKFIYKI